MKDTINSNERLEVLISAMNQKDISIAKKIKCNTDVLIINQTKSKQENVYLKKSYGTIRMLSTHEKGLANSRNMAISNATGDICLICDDDEVLVNDYEKIILSAFKEHQSADIIAFNVEKSVSSTAKPRYKKLINYGATKKARKAPLFKTYSSVQLAFKRKAIVEKQVYFDNRFGAGSGIISSGEETVWQALAKKKGLQIYYVPQTIAYILQEDSQWFSGLNEKYYYDIGAGLAVTYPVFCHFLKFYYAICIVGSKLRVKERIKWLNSGIKSFRKYGYSYDEYLRNKKNTSLRRNHKSN